MTWFEIFELLDAHFISLNDWMETSSHFTENGGVGRGLCLLWLSVLEKGNELMFLTMYTSSIAGSFVYPNRLGGDFISLIC